MTVVKGLPAALTGLDRTLVMGVVNVTPDSFSDGGSYLDHDAAVAHGLELLREGADLVDLGGESTRPGAERVPAEEEARRVLPVVRDLAATGAVVSIDTMRASIAAAALEAGAAVVNDVSGGLADPGMATVVAEAGVPFVAMHWRGHSRDMADRAVYDDVVADVIGELRDRLTGLAADGLDLDQVVVDPGLGFAKRPEHSWALLARLDALAALGRPLLVGASRKGFLSPAAARGSSDGAPSMAERDAATAAVTVLAADRGAWAVRVHDVRASATAVRVVAALRSAGSS